MEVRCALCGQPETVQKWSAEHERLRQGIGTYVCTACQRRVQRESLQQTQGRRPL